MVIRRPPCAHEATPGSPAFITEARGWRSDSGRVVGMCHSGLTILAAPDGWRQKRDTTHWMFGDLWPPASRR